MNDRYHGRHEFSVTPDAPVARSRKLPARHAKLIFPLLLSIFMTCIVSMISTLRSVGPVTNFLTVWLDAWAISWLIAFPTVLVVLPLVRKATAAVVDAE
jgi:hypothetical protein